VNKHSYMQEWPLAAFTLGIQVASGFAIATTISAPAIQRPAQSAALRALGISVFPIVAAGILLSLTHLGRPLSAWRALNNCFHSRLSLEVLLTAVFAVSAFGLSFIWWTGATSFALLAGAIASLLGLAAVIASAAIYRIETKRIWNSAWVTTSFIGSTALVAGLARLMCCGPSTIGTASIVIGSTLLLVSGIWMWTRLSCPLEQGTKFRIWFIGYLLLLIPAPLFVILLPAYSLPMTSVAFVCFLAALGMVTGRGLMLTLGEREQPF
jgi:DMSO reductase anchor subunit